MNRATLLFDLLIPEMRDFVPKSRENRNLALTLGLGIVVDGEVHKCV
jgi:hypothetical protein